MALSLVLGVVATRDPLSAQNAPREGECANNPFPDVNPGPGSLKGLRPLDPPNLNEFIRDRQAAIALGKALFWDMQAGSDGVQSCASCHFRAGADPRSKNQISPGGNDNPNMAFDTGGAPNHQLTAADYPFHKLSDTTDRHSNVLRSIDDVTSSHGIKKKQFTGVTAGAGEDQGTVLSDAVFQWSGKNTRRVPTRNTPTVFNAAFNRRNFWDGRADPIFNGVNDLGARDPDARVVRATIPTQMVAVKLRLQNAAAASQAVGPILNDREMGFVGRNFPSLGRRLLTATPLAKQMVHWEDSSLGRYTANRAFLPRKGLLIPYMTLIQQAFQYDWWLSTQIVEVGSNGQLTFKPAPLLRPLAANEFTLPEYNFSLFFGLAIQLYEATLISDDAPVDRYFDGQGNALTAQQLQGLALFQSNACAACHAGAEFTNASTRIIMGAEGEPAEVVERMMNGQCETVIYDQSFYNIGVRPTAEDLGIGAMDRFGNPLSIARLLTMSPAQIPSQELLTIPYPNVANPPPQLGERVSASGAFKVPSLRNVALTAPYFHNGGQATLRQVVEFYNRGGDFREQNVQFIDFEIGKLNLTESQIDAIVAFLQSLTDDRVLTRKAPFDHPQLFVPNGHASGSEADGTAKDSLMEVPAVGRNGGPALPGFLQ